MSFGLTPLGFNPMQQSDINSAITASLQQAFGQNVNVSSPQTVIGNLVNIFSEREALIWQLAEALYASQYPNGAEGTSVDNVLAYNNLKRLKATPTTTNNTPDLQSNGITLYGLIVLGTPGTVVPAGSIIQSSTVPHINFTLDSPVTISPSLNAIQAIYCSNIPTTGTWTISIDYTDSTGNQANGGVITTESISYACFNAVAADSLDAQSALFVGAFGSGGFELILTLAGVVYTTASITTNDAPSIQAAINALGTPWGTIGVTVTGTAPNYLIQWVNFAGNIPNPLLTIGTNTTGATITPTDSVQAAINNIFDSETSVYPYADVQVAGISGGGFQFTFGAGPNVGANPRSGSQPQATMTTTTSALQNGSNATNLQTSVLQTGQQAQGVGSATCSVNGPSVVTAGFLSIIGSPTSGWTGVTNQLDCLLGTNLETDSAAILRRAGLLAAQANGPLQSIVQKVSEVSGVTAAIGFQNLNNAAQQVLNFGGVTPSTGSFSISVNGLTTGAITDFTSTAAASIQTALQALHGFGSAIVTGNYPSGFIIDWNGSNGGQAVSLATLGSNSTGDAAQIYFGRPPHAIEIVAEGGNATSIATAILGAAPGGIATYGAPFLVTTGNTSTVTNTTKITGLASVANLSIGDAAYGPGIPLGATILAIGVSTVTLSTSVTSTQSGQTYYFNKTVKLSDIFNNPRYIQFSRPSQISLYVALTIVTDQYNTPGVSASGANPSAKWSAGSIATIQQDLIAINDAIPIGGTVIGFGTNGLIGAFNSVPGIVSYVLHFGNSPSPGGNANIALLAEQQSLLESFNIQISWT